MSKFEKGNTVGTKTRFQKGNDLSSKYDDKYCQQLLEFFSKPSIRIEYRETYYKGQLTSRIPIEIKEDYPTFELFAMGIGVTHHTLLNWCKEYPRFSNAYARAKDIQLGKLTSGAVTGRYNPLYAKFEAINNHGQRDKTEVNVNSVPIDNKTLAMIERVEARLNAK